MPRARSSSARHWQRFVLRRRRRCWTRVLRLTRTGAWAWADRGTRRNAGRNTRLARRRAAWRRRRRRPCCRAGVGQVEPQDLCLAGLSLDDRRRAFERRAGSRAREGVLGTGRTEGGNRLSPAGTESDRERHEDCEVARQDEVPSVFGSRDVPALRFVRAEARRRYWRRLMEWDSVRRPVRCSTTYPSHAEREAAASHNDSCNPREHAAIPSPDFHILPKAS